ncbi:hypothetical protein JOJ87_000712 [Rhodococcus ruber]|nr:hypothetical protein [Rhodococcus ruber]
MRDDKVIAAKSMRVAVPSWCRHTYAYFHFAKWRPRE